MVYELPAVLSRLHSASGMSQDEAVAMIKRRTGEVIHQTAFSSYLATSDRHRVPSVTTAATLASAYGVSIEYLLGQVKDRRPIPVLLDRLNEMSLPAPIEGAAKKLAGMPAAIQRKYIAAIEAEAEACDRERRWELLSKLVPETEWRRILATVSEQEPAIAPVVASQETLFELA